MPEMSSATLFTFGLYGYKLISWWNIEPSTPRRQFELAQYYSSSEIREKPFRILAIELFPIRKRHYSTDFIRSETSCKVLQPLTSQWRNGAISKLVTSASALDRYNLDHERSANQKTVFQVSTNHDGRNYSGHNSLLYMKHRLALLLFSSFRAVCGCSGGVSKSGGVDEKLWKFG